MKLNIIKALVTALPLVGLASCMDFDTPADEVTGNQTVVDPTIYKGNADKLDFKKPISEDGFNEANTELQQYFAQMLAGQYYLGGGKNGEMPGPHQWQYVYNLHIDNYAGYFCASQNFSGRYESTYSYFQDFCDGPYGRFLSMKTQLANLLNIGYADSIPEIKAMGLLMFDYAAQEVTDIYGAIPYVDHKNNKETNPFEFNKGVDIYATIIDNLDSIVACFENFPTRPSWYQDGVKKILQQYDGLTFDKSLDSWKRMANGLKLRMAMHMVKHSPDKARKWAEEAVRSGVVESPEQEIGLNTETGFFEMHPAYQIATSWNDTRLNASFESLLFSLDHPYAKYAFTYNSNPITNAVTGEVLPANSRVVGIRAGQRMLEGQQFFANFRVAYSSFTEEVLGYAPIYITKAAEMDFLRAEGAIRGWDMGGDAAMFYERGIRNGQVEDRFMGEQIYSTMVDDYLKVAEAKPYTYVDPYDDSNNHESVTKIGVTWNEADDLETKLEKIITQKYIAMFPYSYEAWTELRRTGYPKIFPVLNANAGDGSLQDGDLIRRIPFPGRNTTVGLDDINNSGIQALEGPDEQATRVFWDIESANF